MEDCAIQRAMGLTLQKVLEIFQRIGGPRPPTCPPNSKHLPTRGRLRKDHDAPTEVQAGSAVAS